MWLPSRNLTPKQAFLLKQPEAGNLIRELRQLAGLTQEQLASVLGVAYGTINRWENGHIQPSPLALKQIRAVLEKLNQSPTKVLQDGSTALLRKYFAGERQES